MSINATHRGVGVHEQHLVLADVDEANIMASAMWASESRYRELVEGLLGSVNLHVQQTLNLNKPK